MSTARLNEALKKKYAAKIHTETDPLELLRANCLSRGAAGIKGFGRVFRVMDDDGNRSLNFAEFKKGLHDYGVDIEPEKVQQLFTRLDVNRSGSLDFEEFLVALRPPMSKARVALIMQAYRKFDKTGDGVVTFEDLKGVYSCAKHPNYLNGKWTEQECLEDFMKTFETPGDADGTITQEEFLNYYAGVSASIDTDAYFDLMMRNAWKL